MSIEDRLSTIQSQLDSLRADIEAQIEARSSSSPQIDLAQHPEVRQAAQALATAIARAQGHDLPLQFADGEQVLPVMEIPESFQRYGGIGIGVMVAPPTEEAY